MINALTKGIAFLFRKIKGLFLHLLTVPRHSASQKAKAAEEAIQTVFAEKKSKRKKRTDYFDLGGFYMAKSLAALLLLAVIAAAVLYLFWLQPLLTSLFGSKSFFVGDEKISDYNGRVRLYYDKKFTVLSFEGRLADGKFTDYGEEFNEEGTPRYRGNYENGRFDGVGTLFYPNGGIRYSGSFSEGKFSGEGEYTDQNGVVYAGIFENGALNGNGTARDASGELLYRGGFEAGEYCGIGSLYENGRVRYAGGFASGSFNGEGTLYGNDGSALSGIFSDGTANGAAIRSYPNGFRTEGNFTRSLENGACKIFDLSGKELFSGELRYGDYDYGALLGASAAEIRERLPASVQKSANGGFMIADTALGIAVRFRSDSDRAPAYAAEIAALPIGGAEETVEPEKHSLSAIGELIPSEEEAPPWAKRILKILDEPSRCFSAVRSDFILKVWTDENGRVIMKTAEITQEPSSPTKGDPEEDPFSDEELRAIFEELGLDIEDFRSLGF